MRAKGKAPASVPTPAPVKGQFDPKSYAKSGITEDEVANIKTAFDLFDTDQGGTIDIKGIFFNTKNLKLP